MKKLVFGLIATVVFGFVGNAQQKEENYKKINVEKLTKDLLVINDSHYSGQQLRSWKSWCQIGVADCGGAWCGSWAGGKVGGLFGPEGAAVGAVAGAVIIGAAASYGASRMAAPGTTPKLLDERILTYDTSIIYLNPNKNPFDISCGKRHNELVVSLIKNNNTEGPEVLTELYNNTEINDNETLFYKDRINTTLEFYSESKNSNNIVETVKNLVSKNISDNILNVIMNSYIDGVYATGNLDDAIKLTYDYENYIISNVEISEEQRTILLMGLSVGKYSFNLWH